MPNINRNKQTRKSSKSHCNSCGSKIYWSQHTGNRLPYNSLNNKPHLASCAYVSEARKRIEGNKNVSMA